MKSLIILSSVFILFACGEASTDDVIQNGSLESQVKEKVDDGLATIEGLDCETFFNSGDYSAMCFVDGNIPKFNGGGCIYAFTTNGDKQEEELKLQITDKKSTALAEMHLNLMKSNYKKGTTTDVANVGDAAFFDVYGEDLGSLSLSDKDLHVRYKNITFKIMSEYLTSAGEPCFSTDEAMITFAQTIIENLQ